MLDWLPRALRRPLPPDPSDPEEERLAAQRLLGQAREILLALGPERGGEGLEYVLRGAGSTRIEVLCPPEVSIELIERLLAEGCTVYEASLALKRDVLVLDRRVGWRLQPWEALPNAFQIAHRLLWSRLGYYTVQVGTVETVHAAERLFTIEQSRLWINAAYRDLPAPRPGDRVRVLGLISYLATSMPVLHAMTMTDRPTDP